MSRIKLITIALGMVSLVGCGGSSGVSSGFPSATAQVGNPTGPGVNGGNNMAPLTGGRTFVYAVSGTITKDYLDSSNTKQTLSGPLSNATLTRVITNVGTAGTATTYQITDTLTYTLQGMPPSVEVSTWFLNQNADNSLWLVGINKFGYQATTTNAGGDPFAPSVFSTTSNLGGTSSLNYNLAPYGITVQGSTVTQPPVTYLITAGSGSVQTSVTEYGQESVPTTTGAAYTAWKTLTSDVESWTNDLAYQAFSEALPVSPGSVVQSTSTKSSVDDWVPSLGAPVRSQITLSESDTVAISATTQAPTYTTPPSITYSLAPTLNKKETITAVLTSSH
jgi:hypothetical protein